MKKKLFLVVYLFVTLCMTSPLISMEHSDSAKSMVVRAFNMKRSALVSVGDGTFFEVLESHLETLIALKVVGYTTKSRIYSMECDVPFFCRVLDLIDDGAVDTADGLLSFIDFVCAKQQEAVLGHG